MGIFLDLIALDEHSTNDALELMCKSQHSHDGDIWLPIDNNPFIARLVELFTERGLDRLEAFRTELLAWSNGQRHTPGLTRLPRPEGYMERWSPGEVSLVKLYLEHLPPELWTLDDHMLSVDFLVHRYLPADDLRTEAEWLSSRASIMGRVQVNMEKLTPEQADTVVMALPTTVQGAVLQFGLSAAQHASMDYARVRCAENVRAVSESARHRMRTTIADHVQAETLGTPGPGHSLETKLFDQFAVLNKDWRRVAVTEAAEAHNMGYVASVPSGSRLKRIEQYKGRCAWCQSIDGRVVTVVDPADPDKDPDTQIWVGKTNVGRSASPRKRVGTMLVDREPDEMWTIAAGTQHPHCRGKWQPVIEDEPGDDAEFGDFLRNLLT